MLNIRKRMLGRFAELLRRLHYVIVPSGIMTFRCYRLVHNGWIWFIFPKLALKEIGDLNLGQVIQHSVKTLQAPLRTLADSSKRAIGEAVEVSARRVAAAYQAGLKKRESKLILGTQKTPSAILAAGRKSTQALQRSMIEAVGDMAVEEFQKTAHRSLAQMLAYAREEAGAVREVEQALPQGTRFVYYGDPITLYIIEELPRVRTIKWDGKFVSLSFPYVVFPVYLKKNSFEAMQMFIRNEPLETPADKLYIPPLPDIMATVLRDNVVPRELRYRYWVCFPGPDIRKGAHAEVVKAAQQNFWLSEFRSGHWSRSVEEMVANMPDFSIKKWKKLTDDDPGAILKTKWVETAYTPAKLGGDLKPLTDGFNPRESFSRLERQVAELATRIGSSTKELVLATMEKSRSLKEAKATFDLKLKEAVDESSLATALGEAVLEELRAAGANSEIASVITATADKASEHLAKLITPALTTAATHMATQLQEPTEEYFS